MTLVVGFVANDRAVMAADSQGTEADGTRSVVDKIWCERGLLFGYAGTQAVRDNLKEAIAYRLSSATPGELQDRKVVEQKICGVSKTVLEAMYANYVSDIGERPKDALGGQLLVMGCGANSEGHWLLEVDRDNTPTYYTEPGFHAAGSGSPAAQITMALLQSYVPQELSLRQLQALAYRTVSASVRVLAQYVSEPIAVWTCDGKGSFVQATNTEIQDIGGLIEAWLTVERESILSVEPPDDDGEDKPPLPAPPEAGAQSSVKTV
jgi:20S proteasome alpha/beta subunit